MPAPRSDTTPRHVLPTGWSADTVGQLTLRLSLVAVATAVSFEIILIAMGGLATADHVIIGVLIAGTALAAGAAARGHAAAGAALAIGTLWLVAAASVYVHGVRATALPTLTVSTILAALWGGPRLGVALVAASIGLLAVASGVFGAVLPAPIPVDPAADLVVIVGQFVFVAALAVSMSRVIGDVRDDVRQRDERLMATTAELQATRTAQVATQARYEQLVQALPDAVIALAPDGTITEVNDAIERLLGHPTALFLGKRLGDVGLFAPGDRDRAYAMLGGILEGRTMPPLVVSLRHRDGSRREIEATARGVTNPEGEPRALAILRDVTERRRTERARRMLAQAVDGAQNAMAITDVDATVTYVNAAFVRLWGLPAAADAIGRPAADFWADPPAVEQVFARLRDGEREVRGELVGRRADGSGIDIDLAASPILDEGGQLVGFMGSFSDVSDRNAALQALRYREAQLRRASRIARLGAWELDLEQGTLTWDEEVKRIHEVPPDFAPTVETAIEFYAPEAREEITAALGNVVETGAPMMLEMPLVTARGRRIQVLAQGEAAERRDGKVVKVHGIFQDITERHDTIRLLRQAEERNRAIVEASSDMIVLLATDGTILYEAPSIERILGIAPEEAVGRNVMEWLHPDDLAAAGEGFTTLLSEPGAEITSRLRYRHADGSYRRLETIGRNMLDVPGVNAIFAMGRDITEREQLEEQLRETQKLESIGRLAGGIAHDFNNLLMAILGYAEELAETVPPDSTAAQDVAEIRRAGRRARELTGQLLAFARRQVVVPRTLELAGQLGTAERFLRRVLGEDVRLDLTIADDAGHVRMDPAQLEQVVLNLAVNARDAMPDGGTLTIRVAARTLSKTDALDFDVAPGRFAELRVRDTGEGMSPEVTSRIFEPFYTTKALGKGTGLGLATVYGIVRQAGGGIHVESAPGAGSTFTVVLPLVDAEPRTGADDEPSGASAPTGGDETVLLAEDDAAVRTLTARLLRAAGYTVIEAPDGPTAESIVAQREAPIDLLVTDVVMPGMSGPELAERLVARQGDLPVLLLSGYTEKRLETTAVAERADFLAKPFSREALLSRVRTLLDAADAGVTGSGEFPTIPSPHA